MLKHRVLTAIPLAIVVAGTILYLDTVYVVALFTLLMGLAMRELVNLTLSRNLSVQVPIAVVFAAIFWLSTGWADTSWKTEQLWLADVLWVVIVGQLFFYTHREGQQSLSKRTFVWVYASILLWVCGHALLIIHTRIDNGGWMLMYLLTLVWIADIGAYFAGKKFGKHKLAPAISPGKTWQGVIGGLGLNVVWISLIFVLADGWGMSYPLFLLLGLVTSMISVVGDLYESILKRDAGVKDSGVLLPGHGGVLDRIDSIIAAAPIFVTGLILAGRIV